MMRNDNSLVINGLQDTETDTNKRPSSSTKGVVIFGVIVVVAIFLGLGIWSATAPLARAISAGATLTIKGERKTIQHFEGGIIGSLHVTEGQQVQKGDLLVALNPLQAIAAVARNNSQFNQALAREARLESELRWELDLILTDQFLERLNNDPQVFKIFEAEQRHLKAKRDTIDGHIAILDQRIDQLDNEIKGLEIQRSARIEQFEIFKDEIVGLRDLHRKGYFPRSKLLAMERAMVQIRGAAGNDLAQIARAKSGQQEAENQIISVKQRYRESVVKELRDVQAEISDLNERVLVAKDILQRVSIRAPKSGIVQGIKFHTVGGVVKPGEAIMEIAPQDVGLMVNAQVSPTDIDNIVIGQRAEVRLTALNQRTTPAIYGVVVTVSGDMLTDQRSGEPFFLSRIEIPVEERKKLGEVKLTAGMPADVLIQTGERTVLNYILRPLTDAFARGLNEE
jgi:HlyD family type I secretion membrane fusion protein